MNMSRISSQQRPDLTDVLLWKRQREDQARRMEAKRKEELGESKTAQESREVKPQKKVNQAGKGESLSGKDSQKPEQTPQDRTWPPRMDQYVRGDSRPSENGETENLKQEGTDPDALKKVQGDEAPAPKADPDQNSPQKVNGEEKDPKKTDEDEDKNNKSGKKAGRKKAERCIGNTDEVDREIRKLKKKRDQLKQQLAQAKEDPEKEAKIQKQLAQVENELKMKDNEGYRRQHTKYTNL